MKKIIKKSDAFKRMNSIMSSLLEGSNNVPFSPVPLTQMPSKPRTNLRFPENGDDFADGSGITIFNDLRDDDSAYGPGNLNTQTDTDVEKIRKVLNAVVSLYTDKSIKVKRRGETENGMMYDVYFENNHTILYVQPNHNKIVLINRNMDDDYFSDVVEDIQEITVEPDQRKWGKLLLSITNEYILPKLPDNEPGEVDAPSIEDDIDETDVENIPLNTELSDDDLELDDDPTDDEIEADTEDDGEVETDVEVEPEEEEEDKKKEKEKLEDHKIYDTKIMEDTMKTVKDIKAEYGYKFMTGTDAINSVAQYFNEEVLKKFGGFYVLVEKNEYVDVYGILGDKSVDTKPVTTIVENKKYIFDGKMEKNPTLFEIGEMVRIDMTQVRGEYRSQIYNITRHNQGYAIIESIEGGLKIAQNASIAKDIGGIPINDDAVVKITEIVDAVMVYEQDEVEAELKLLSEDAGIKRDLQHDLDEKKLNEEVSGVYAENSSKLFDTEF